MLTSGNCREGTISALFIACVLAVSSIPTLSTASQPTVTGCTDALSQTISSYSFIGPQGMALDQADGKILVANPYSVGDYVTVVSDANNSVSTYFSLPQDP